jgi:hypothetical protein
VVGAGDEAQATTRELGEVGLLVEAPAKGGEAGGSRRLRHVGGRLGCEGGYGELAHGADSSAGAR